MSFNIGRLTVSIDLTCWARPLILDRPLMFVAWFGPVGIYWRRV